MSTMQERATVGLTIETIDDALDYFNPAAGDDIVDAELLQEALVGLVRYNGFSFGERSTWAPLNGRGFAQLARVIDEAGEPTGEVVSIWAEKTGQEELDEPVVTDDGKTITHRNLYEVYGFVSFPDVEEGKDFMRRLRIASRKEWLASRDGFGSDDNGGTESRFSQRQGALHAALGKGMTVRTAEVEATE